ncbi:MAG: hypothetical protein E7351_01570 [Clostridiales bacterium]|nr:hypothetical protein [Clostridiales bacterium]
MSVGKRIAIILSIVAVAVIGVLGYLYYPAIQGLITGNKYYTQEDVQDSYDDGYKDGFETETELKEKLSYYMTMVDEYQLNIETLNLEVARITKQNQNLQTDIQVLEDTKAKNISTIAELTDSNKAKDGTINSLNSDISELRTNINNLVSEIETLENDVATKSSRIAVLENNIETLDNQIATLEASGENKDAEISELKTQKAVLETEKTNLQEDIANANSQIDSLNEQLTAKNEEIAGLNNTIVDLEKEIANNEILIEELQESNTNLNEQLTTLNTQLANSSNEIYTLNNRITNLEKSVEDYERYITELENTNSSVAIFEFDNSVYEIKEVDENGFVSIDDPVSTENVIFNYWTLNGEQVDLSTYQITKTTKFVADVTRNYNVIFEVDGEVIDTQLIEENNFATAPQDPVKDKFEFAGWSIDGVSTLDISNYIVTSNTTFRPVYNNLYGLFNSDTGRLTYTWEELLHYDYLKVTDNVLSAGANYKRIAGELRIDSDINSIADSTFNGCSALVKVVIPESVVSIGKTAFNNCASLLSVTLPTSLKSVGSSAFGLGFNTASITEVVYKGTLEQWCDIDFVDEKSSPVYSSKSIIINNELLQGTIIIPLTLKNIKPYVFTGFNNEFIFHNEVESIGKGAFTSSSLTMLNLPESCSSIEQYAFSGCNKLVSVHLPTTLKEIKSYTFTSCSKLESIDLSNVETIRGWAFRYCSGLKTLTLEDNITTLEHSAFDYCTGVEVLNYNIPTLPDYPSVTQNAIGHNFGSANGLTMNFLEKVKRLPRYFCGSVEQVLEINLGENIEYIDYNAFFSTETQVVNYNCRNAVLNRNGSHCVTIHFDRWADANLTFNIGANVEMIPSYMFFGASQMTHINFPETAKYTELLSHTFYGCDDLISVNLPKNLTVLGADCFNGCESLPTIELPSGLTKIDEDCFYQCFALDNITLPTTLTYIGGGAFDECKSLTSLFIPKSVTYMGYAVFNRYCSSMSYVYFEVASEPSTFDKNWDSKYTDNNNWGIKWGYTYEQYLAEISAT